jgi:pimeloyl-ACP methyl ester carboxylesterase
MPKLYFISGLGADCRAFGLIDSFEGYESIFLEWISNHKNESLKSYASRLIERHSITENDIIVGLSFGGLVAQEIIKLTSCKTIILISSFRDKHDLKPQLQFLLNLHLYHLLPNYKISWFDKFVVHFFSIKSKEGKEGFLDMMRKTDPKLTKWSMMQIRKFVFDKNHQWALHNIIGDKDKLLKTWGQEKNNYLINKGGHLMVYENAKEINKTLKEILKSVNG